MSNKEASRINDLLEKVSEQHKPNSYIFKNVNTLTMLDSQIVEQDVLIKNGVIKEIGINIINQAAIEIDGKGKYLMPGLTDMHIHLFDQHQMKNIWMLLLLVNGVTSVRDMAGEPGKLVLRDKIKNNEVLAPNIYQAGPIINGMDNPPTLIVASTPEEGRKQVIEQKKTGYDFIKVYDDLNKETYLAILDEAQKQAIPVVGHLPIAISIEEALNKQSSIEHLTGYKGWRNNVKAYLIANEDYATSTARSSTWNCPTLYNLLINWDKEMAENVLANQDITSLLPSKLIKRWESLMLKDTDKKEALLAEYGENNKELFAQIVSGFYKSNAKLVAGTDAGSIPLLVPGFSLHEELAALNIIGIANYDVLKMATTEAALAMEKEKEFGTIEIGKRADLLLLDSNPLEDINNLKKQTGIMVRGIWLSNSESEQIKQEIKTAFGN
ncbi:amidohydrolase family protein [Mangrovivirga sp. M17]|uniref:Amidohydrolase family protein n=1 Tax=Mangrovivirga halotolerans TaxID=2993936 RepID=A0ABT3RQL3_9BACT|nr:amidohydrolase family protein [Mangrovivirga halotolerans]MCX2743781.1 amidohydrolase family protein [Mangrovivirga halotolerans]